MATKQEITDAAFRLFAERGFHETTTDSIAKMIGLKKQSLYSHFSNKKEIVFEVLNEHSEQISRVVDEILIEDHDKPADILLKSIFIRLARYFSQREKIMFWKRIFLFEANGEFSDIIKNSNYSFHKKMVTELGDILRSRYPYLNDPDRLRSFLLSYMVLISGYMDWLLTDGFDLNTIEKIYDVFWYCSKSLFQE
jgi:AcrR family transcriptional regulator